MVPTPAQSAAQTASDSPELRRDPVAGRWVIIAPERGQRPHPSTRPSRRSDAGPCPFCAGNEKETPPEIAACRAPGSPPDGPGWTTRVIPNRFPALSPRDGRGPASDGLYERMDGVGAHEVIIESPDHDADLSELSPEGIEQVLSVARDRVAAACRDPRVRYALVFKNYGEWAGASQEHSHTQLLATPVIPSVAQEELTGSRRHFQSRGGCVFCEMVAREVAQPSRLVAEDAATVAFTPYASRFPYETWIVPRRHASSFEHAEAAEIHSLASMLRGVLGRFRATLSKPAYNLLIHSAPCREPALEWYHWHLEVIPKLTTGSGFEWGTGAYINATPPEEAAARLRLDPAGRAAS